MKKILTHPLISCICITKNRPHQLLRAIRCFSAQNYPNRELVISYPIEDIITPALLDNISDVEYIRILRVVRENTATIGMARNQAVERSGGTFCCIWDDDDWSLYNRLAHQYNNMLVNRKYKEACILTRITLHDGIENNSYISETQLWPGTLLARRDYILEEPYGDSNFAEETNLLHYLKNKKVLHLIEDCPYLYIYFYHGVNITAYRHFKTVLTQSILLDSESNEWIKKILAIN